jgi:hypothetical protein
MHEPVRFDLITLISGEGQKLQILKLLIMHYALRSGEKCMRYMASGIILYKF